MPHRSAIGSMSLGRPWIHDLPSKLREAGRYGFEGIELFYEDLECLAHTVHGGCIFSAARHTRQLCDSLHLAIVNIQPFSFYEGLLDRNARDLLLQEKLPLWFRLVDILGTDLIQVPSNFLPRDHETGALQTTGNLPIIVSDLQELADLGLQRSPPIRFAYEALAWSNHVDTWEQAWDIVQRVDRPNFGICLDTFNLAGRVYADPSCPTGKTPKAEAALRASISRIPTTVDPAKIFFLQVVDGERLAEPLDERHEYHVPGQPARMSWSRNARLFPFEEDRGGYLPVADVARSFFDTGFEGWVSLELFSRTLADPDPKTPREHARRGMESYLKLERVLGLQNKCRGDAMVTKQQQKQLRL